MAYDDRHGRRTEQCESLALRVDAANALVEVGAQRLRLSPRAFAVLLHLIHRAGELVTKEELFSVVWRGAVVSDGALVVCIRELRKALEDDARHPRYIETVQRRGYRFVGPLADRVEAHHESALACCIGREDEMRTLASALKQASAGRRQVVFIAGDPGIGKTTLVDAFLAGLRTSPPSGLPPLVAHGQCVDHHGAAAAWFPLLDALERLCRGADGLRAVGILERHAPTWLAQIPGLLVASRQETFLRLAQGASQMRLLNELALALELITKDRLLVLVLEDLHWSDPSTVAAIATLARRVESARLLLLGTYRKSALRGSDHPLWSERNELVLHERCTEVALGPWSRTDIATWLDTRLENRTPASATHDSALVEHLHSATAGNPLFVRSVFDELVATGAVQLTAGGWGLAAAARHFAPRIPSELRELLTWQGERLDAEQRSNLLAASVVGLEFSAAEVAAALDRDIVAVEDGLQQLAQHGLFVQRAGIVTWPDGSISARFAFLHALYRQTWLEQLVPSALQRYNHRVGLCLEAAWGGRSDEISVELASRFCDARDLPRAVRYLRIAGTSAARRSAHREAQQLLALGLDLVRTLPRSVQAEREELRMQTTLGPILIAARGYAAPEVEQTYAAARALSLRAGDTPQVFVALSGLWHFYVMRPRHRMALSIAQRLVELAERSDAPEWRVEARWAHGCSLFLLGLIREGHAEFESALTAYRSQASSSLAFEFGHDPGVSALSFGALTAWQQGLLQTALSNTREAMALADTLGHPYSRAYAMTFGAWIYLLLRRDAEASDLARATLTFCAAHGNPLLLAMSGMVLGIAEIRLGLGDATLPDRVARCIDDYLSMGGEGLVPHFLTLYAEICIETGDLAAAGAAIERAATMMARNEDRWCEAEILRVRARIHSVLNSPTMDAAARQDLVAAISIAEQQGAWLLVLRAALDYAALEPCTAGEASAAIRRALPHCAEGFGHLDVQRAHSWLEAHESASRCQ